MAEIGPSLLFLAGFFPILRAWLILRRTSLNHAAGWALLAWASWGPVLTGWDAQEPWRFLALCMSACAGVAVLGARRPHVLAWNFVVLGLLAVMTLPLLETLALGPRPFGTVRAFFLPAILAIGIGNYLPTSFGPAALLAALSCAGEAYLLANPDHETIALTCRYGSLAVPWLALACWYCRRHSTSALDQAWLNFRDAFGLFWSLRVREQFNNAAKNRGWHATLSWRGFSIKPGEANASALLSDFRAVIQRFAAS